VLYICVSAQYYLVAIFIKEFISLTYI